MVTEQVARRGVPLAAKSVYFACTCWTYPRKLVTAPHSSCTRGGQESGSSGSRTRQPKSFSTRSTTLPSGVLVPSTASRVLVASKKSSRVSLHGSEPVNCAGEALAALAAVPPSHLADFAIDISLGL